MKNTNNTLNKTDNELLEKARAHYTVGEYKLAIPLLKTLYSESLNDDERIVYIRALAISYDMLGDKKSAKENFDLMDSLQYSLHPEYSDEQAMWNNLKKNPSMAKDFTYAYTARVILAGLTLKDSDHDESNFETILHLINLECLPGKCEKALYGNEVYERLRRVLVRLINKHPQKLEEMAREHKNIYALLFQHFPSNAEFSELRTLNKNAVLYLLVNGDFCAQDDDMLETLYNYLYFYHQYFSILGDDLYIATILNRRLNEISAGFLSALARVLVNDRQDAYKSHAVNKTVLLITPVFIASSLWQNPNSSMQDLVDLGETELLILLVNTLSHEEKAENVSAMVGQLSRFNKVEAVFNTLEAVFSNRSGKQYALDTITKQLSGRSHEQTPDWLSDFSYSCVVHANKISSNSVGARIIKSIFYLMSAVCLRLLQLRSKTSFDQVIKRPVLSR